jgi:hypothetical protein
MYARSIVVFGLTLFATVSTAMPLPLSADQPSPESVKRLEQLLSGFKNERDRLVTGSFNANGKVTIESRA